MESGISLDYCPVCQVIWFDKNELEQYCKRNKILLSTNVQSGPLLDVDCPKCGTPLTEQKLVDNEFCACQNCGGFLVSSKLIDNKLPEKSNARPMQQLDGPVSFIEILGLLSPWW